MTADYWNQIKNIASEFRGKPIYIIGKGPSLDLLPANFRPDGLTLCINDAEVVVPGHIAVATQPWVAERIAEHQQPSSALYLTSTSQKFPNQLVLPQIPDDLRAESLAIRRLEEPELYAENVGIRTIVKICIHLSQAWEQPVKTFFLGFDFGFGAGDHANAVSQETDTDHAIRKSTIIAQENLFIQLRHYFAHKGYGELLHIGGKPYSSLNLARFIEQTGNSSTARRELPKTYQEAESQPVWIVAEFTNNHLGDIDRLLRMVRLAKNSGADLIKVQKRHVDGFYSNDQLDSYYWSPFGNTLGDYRRGVELSDEAFEALDEECHKNNIHWFCSILDIESYQSIERFNPQLVKIPSTISNHTNYHGEIINSYKGGFVVSTGMTDASYEKHVLDHFGSASPLFLLQCTSAYPTPPTACQLAVIRHYRVLAETYPNIIPGFSSHDSGSLGSMLAVAAGAKMIEKHVKLGDVDWIHFDKVAIDLENNDFASFVKDVRKAETMAGNEQKIIHKDEHHKYAVSNPK